MIESERKRQGEKERERKSQRDRERQSDRETEKSRVKENDGERGIGKDEYGRVRNTERKTGEGRGDSQTEKV